MDRRREPDIEDRRGSRVARSDRRGVGTSARAPLLLPRGRSHELRSRWASPRRGVPPVEPDQESPAKGAPESVGVVIPNRETGKGSSRG